jgi:putative transposase
MAWRSGRRCSADLRERVLAAVAGGLPAAAVNETLFSSLPQARAVLAAWRRNYNRTRPHSAPANASPAEFAEKIRLAEEAP